MPRAVPQPVLEPVDLAELRPTQMTVGLVEVARRRTEWIAREDRDRPAFLARHMIPVVLGPRERRWMIDNHHLARALHDEGVTHVLVSVVADLSHLKSETFLTYMDNRNWLHPFDEQGRRRDYEDLPKHIAKLRDDPYRSLAGAVRRAGGFAKVETPYAEFLWADFYRRRIKPGKIEDDFEGAVRKGVTIARTGEAEHLPGWAGVEH